VKIKANYKTFLFFYFFLFYIYFGGANCSSGILVGLGSQGFHCAILGIRFNSVCAWKINSSTCPHPIFLYFQINLIERKEDKKKRKNRRIDLKSIEKKERKK